MKFETIRQFAARGLISEYCLRLMVKAGEVPGIQSGNRYLINTKAFLEQLGQEVEK